MSERRKHKNRQDFIPARESAFFIRFFGWYTKRLFIHRFKHIWLKQHYFPDSNSRTIYYLNHSSWWDGITPLLLNQYLFRQNARAMMEDKQMKQYKFFRWIGAFSVSLNETRGSVRSLRYAVKSMQRDNASLFIYPEGKIVPFSTSQPEFQGGLNWLYRQLPEVEVVPIGTYIHTLRYNRPEIHIQIGEPVQVNKRLGPGLQTTLEKALQKQLIELHQYGGFDDAYFLKWF